MVSPAVLMSAPQPRAQVSAAWSWHSHREENMVQRREEVVLAGPQLERQSPTLPCGNGVSVSWAGKILAGSVCLSRKLSQTDLIS